MLVRALAILSTLCLIPAAFSQPGCSLRHVNGYQVLTLKGTPEEMGTAHGRLLGPTVRRVVDDVILHGEAATPEAYARLMAGTARMERQLPDDIRRELCALAVAAEVKYQDLVALQLFGDVWRAPNCSSFAVFGPATATGEPIIGRNFDFWDHGVGEYASLIIAYQPEQGLPFMTITWAGIINGWTAMNTSGLVAANNTSWGRSDSLDGLSTCFMIRKIVQHARTVAQGVDIVQNTPRACGTNMLIAGGTPTNAAVVEYDHENVVVRWAERDVVIATNHFRKLYQEPPMGEDDGWCGRYNMLRRLINENYGAIDRTMNFIADPNVSMGSMNQHSVLLFPQDLSFRVSMGRTPASEYPYRRFRLTSDGVVAD
ncbi:MAG: C45 family autoproteolytic acyltransferase/hydrolase [Bacteroidota bacterium]